MPRGSFRQADIERIIRAAEKTGAAVQVDLRSLVVTIFPGAGSAPKPAPPLQLQLAPDGEENWEEDATSSSKPIYWEKGIHPPIPIDPPFDHRESVAMDKLIELGVDVPWHPAGTRGFGPHTQKKLADRGYIQIIHQPGGKYQDDEVVLTKKGLSDWKAQKAHWKKYWSL